MTTMPIVNHQLTQGRLQFKDINVNKLTFKSINIIQSSSNYNIVSRFICWNQNIVEMKILDTSFEMTKKLSLGVKGMYYESKMKYEYQCF